MTSVATFWWIWWSKQRCFLSVIGQRGFVFFCTHHIPRDKRSMVFFLKMANVEIMIFYSALDKAASLLKSLESVIHPLRAPFSSPHMTHPSSDDLAVQNGKPLKNPLHILMCPKTIQTKQNGKHSTLRSPRTHVHGGVRCISTRRAHRSTLPRERGAGRCDASIFSSSIAWARGAALALADDVDIVSE